MKSKINELTARRIVIGQFGPKMNFFQFNGYFQYAHLI